MLELPEIVDTYNCSQCSHRTESIFQLNHHVQRNHKNVYAVKLKLFHAIVEPEQFFCICCNYKGYYQFELYEHCKQVHNQGTTRNNNKNGTLMFCEEIAKYSCHYCKYESDSTLSYVKHHVLCRNERTTTGEQTRDIADAEGAEGVESPDFHGTVERPIRYVGVMESNMWTYGSSEKIKGFQCKHCSYQVKRHSLLMRHHMLKHATNEEINWFQCNHCSYRGKLKSSLKLHLMNHATNEEINWFQCNHCSYRAKVKSYLKRHNMFMHTTNEKINWFQCNGCSYRAKRNSDLKRHLLKHAASEEIDWFQCEQCSYRVDRKSHLKRHLLKHATDEEINWFQCDHCSYRGKRKSQVKVHMLKHATDEEINWFQCDHCSHRFKHKFSLKRHLLKHATNEIN